MPDDLHLLRQSMKSRTRGLFEGRGHLYDPTTFILSSGRRFMTTEMSLGFVPYETRVGDRIAILISCSVPVVVRQIMETGRISHLSLIDQWYRIGRRLCRN